MTGPATNPDSDQHGLDDRFGDAGAGAPGSTVGAPRWVKVFGLIVLAIAVMVVVMLLTGGGPGKHGPGRHQTSAGMAGQPLAAVAERVAAPA